jgi:hypothetical protein
VTVDFVNLANAEDRPDPPDPPRPGCSGGEHQWIVPRGTVGYRVCGGCAVIRITPSQFVAVGARCSLASGGGTPPAATQAPQQKESKCQPSPPPR